MPKPLTCDKHYRHDLTDDESATVCGIDVDDEDARDITIACGCGDPECSKPVNCPTCLALLEGRVN